MLMKIKDMELSKMRAKPLLRSIQGKMESLTVGEVLTGKNPLSYFLRSFYRTYDRNLTKIQVILVETG